MVLPLVPSKPLRAVDLSAKSKLAQAAANDPNQWAEAVFGEKLYNNKAVRKTLPPGSDINGDGIPDLAVGYDNGMHCCNTCVVYSLGAKFDKIFDIDGRSLDVLFKDIDGDGVCEVLVSDWTFESWNVSYAESPFPRVIMAIKNGNQLRVATQLMKAPVIANSYIVKIVDETKKAIQADSKVENPRRFTISPAAIGNVLSLIYVGHALEAWQYVDQFWPSGETAVYWGQVEGALKGIGKDEFKEQIRKQLSSSPYYSGIKELNGGEI